MSDCGRADRLAGYTLDRALKLRRDSWPHRVNHCRRRCRRCRRRCRHRRRCRRRQPATAALAVVFNTARPTDRVRRSPRARQHSHVTATTTRLSSADKWRAAVFSAVRTADGRRSCQLNIRAMKVELFAQRFERRFAGQQARATPSTASKRRQTRRSAQCRGGSEHSRNVNRHSERRFLSRQKAA